MMFSLSRSLGQVRHVRRPANFIHANTNPSGIKEYSDWPTIPQLYIDKEFVGGADIIMTMHKDGSLFDTLKEKGLVVLEDDSK